MSSLSNNLPDNIKRYRKRRFPFNLTDNLKCVICSELLLNAMQTDCGCRYCQKCIEDHLVNSRQCSTKGCSTIISTMPDNAINKEIGKLMVKCLYDGCNHEEMLKDIGDHLNSCEYLTVVCEKCKLEMPGKMLPNHLLKDCVKRVVKCLNCESRMEYEILMKFHLDLYADNICPKLVDKCPYGCDIVGAVNLLAHRKECVKKPVRCPFVELGCSKVLTNQQLSDHMKTEFPAHIRTLVEEFIKMKKEITSLETKLIESSKTIKLELSNFQNEISTKISNIDQMSNSSLSLQSSSSLTLQSSASSMANILKSNDEKINYRNGVFIWKVEHFPELKANAERGNRISVTSEPFYTKEFGYKMSMKIYPAGDGVGKSTHLSVFFTLMKGDFDDLLVWPFKNKVTLTILDQKNKTSDYSDTFKPDPRSTCYQQPTEEYNIASGSPKFISFTQLQEYYMKNDTIFLKIVVLN